MPIQVQQVQPPPKLPEENKPYQIQEVQRTQLTAEEQNALDSFQQHSGSQVAKTKTIARSKVGDLLSSPQAARDAIVLSEILGKPKGSLPN